MALDFPASPNVGDTYTSAGRVWQWDGTKWIPASSGGIAYSPIYVSDTPPVGPIPGALWWDSSVGQGELSIYYNDPNSSQWVPASNVAGSYLPIGGGALTGDLVLPAIAPVTPASAVPKAYVDANYSGFVNKLRNGTFDVWQRGSPINIPATSANYGPDGWYVSFIGAAGTAAFGSNNSNQPPGRLIAILTGSAGVTSVGLTQRIESYVAASLAGLTCTFQIWAYSTVAQTPQFQLSHPSVADTSPWNNFDTALINMQPLPASTWTRLAYTFNVPVASALLGLQVNVAFPGALGAGQVLLGAADLRATPNWPVGLCPNPPPPELRPIATELAFCQRYYQTGYGGWWGNGTSGFNFVIVVPFGTPKRATPTVVMTDTSSIGFPAGSPTLGGTQPTLNFTAFKTCNATGSNNFAFNWTASAEL